MTKRKWKIARGVIEINQRTLVMGILNSTPDSFSDGGKFSTLDRALARADTMIEEGANIIDIGGESTRPGAEIISEAEELRRVIPLIEKLNNRCVIAVDTTKAEVARRSLEAGAHIINDVSGLRFAPEIAGHVARYEAGIVLMHSLGTLETLHAAPSVKDVFAHVQNDWRRAIDEAERRGVKREQIALDVGFGFGKTFEQNLELLARLDELAREFKDFPLLVGTSRKRFIGKILHDAPVDERLHGTLATVAVANLKGANIVRVHDVKAAADTVRVVDAIKKQELEVRSRKSE